MLPGSTVSDSENAMRTLIIQYLLMVLATDATGDRIDRILSKNSKIIELVSIIHTVNGT